ncbi:phage terminase large subunit family protein [Pseudomonas sp. NPDC090592]|uniref:Clp protease ClpP n=1 Tax=Pseudomonas sp. NPDC090592 TaxID=3364480 RepID=UPI00383B1B92
MPTGYADGAKVYREAYGRGLKPDPELWVDEWSDEYMRIPRDTGAAEPGKYRTARTPYAREPMRCLSPAHPCKRVITMVASQLMKTQIALNWIGALIHMSPSNILTLLPSLALCGAHRVVMASNAILMIHNPYTWAGGNAEELRRVADVLDQAFEVIIAAYKAKAPGIDEAELRRMVNDETWLTAQEALELGLADEVGNGLQVRACLGQGTAMARYRKTPKALLDQLASNSQPPVDGPATPSEPPAPDPADATALALMITQACAKAGIGNLVESLIASTKLTSPATVQAALKRAKDVHGLCVPARLPELTAEFVTAGLEPDAVRARLFEKVVGSGKGIEIDNSLPPADDEPEKVKAQLPNPSSIWAARRQAANKGARP